MAHCFSLAIADESIFILGGKKDILNKAVQVDKESRHGCISQANFKSFYFVFQSLPEAHGDTLLFYTSPI